MDEATWLTSRDPAAMLDWLTTNHTGGGVSLAVPGDRKLRLFALASVRLTDPHAGELRFASLIEGMADRGATDEEYLAVDCLLKGPGVRWARHQCGRSDTVPFRPAVAGLLREIVGNPFSPVSLCGNQDHGSVTVRPYCAACQRLRTPTVLSLAQAAYARPRCENCTGPGGERLHYTGKVQHQPCPECGRGAFWTDDGTLDPLRLAILADALEEAGCDSEPLLRHLRGYRPCYYCADNPAIDVAAGEWCTYCGHERWLSGDFGPGPHVRGCWALDLILGKP